jgi:hypothetical protein
MIKAMENEPTLLLRVVASIMLDPYRERLPPKMGDCQREPARASVKGAVGIPNES